MKDVRELQKEVRRLTYSAAEAIDRVLRGLEDREARSSLPRGVFPHCAARAAAAGTVAGTSAGRLG